MGQRGPNARPKQDASWDNDPAPWNAPGLSRSQAVITFLEFLPITKGKLAGQQMQLLPYQREFVEAIYGEVGKRPYKMGVQSVPRGQGKTGLLAGLALCHMVGPESEPRGEVFCAALDSQQAGILFQECEAIIQEVPRFEACINVIRHFKKMEVLQGPGKGSTLQCMSRDAKKAHGLAPSFWIYDELAQSQDGGELLRNLQTGQGKRDESLGIVISTQAPTDQHPLSELIDDPDKHCYVQCISAPEDAEITDEVVLACNPAAGVFLDEEELLIQAEKARNTPSFEAAFRNLRMNQRISAEAGYVDQVTWKLNSKAPLETAFREGDVYAGLDMSLRDDLTALVLAAFHKGEWHIRPYFWVPPKALEERRIPYDVWAEQGAVFLTSGPTVDYEQVATLLADLHAEYGILNIGFDRWGIQALTREFDLLGVELPLKEFGQGFKTMAPALNTLSALLLNAKIRHGNNPPLTMCAANAVVETDAVNNRKFTKPRSRGKIDGMVALAMAIGVSELEEPEIEVTGVPVFA